MFCLLIHNDDSVVPELRPIDEFPAPFGDEAIWVTDFGGLVRFYGGRYALRVAPDPIVQAEAKAITYNLFVSEIAGESIYGSAYLTLVDIPTRTVLGVPGSLAGSLIDRTLFEVPVCEVHTFYPAPLLRADRDEFIYVCKCGAATDFDIKTSPEPEDGSVIMLHGPGGTAHQRFYSDGAWRSASTGKKKGSYEQMVTVGGPQVHPLMIRRTDI